VIYDLGREEISVNMAKGGFYFSAAGRIPAFLTILDKDCLIKWTPCTDLEDEGMIEAVAITHVEFILAHPFRDGNGRIYRLLVVVVSWWLSTYFCYCNPQSLSRHSTAQFECFSEYFLRVNLAIFPVNNSQTPSSYRSLLLVMQNLPSLPSL